MSNGGKDSSVQYLLGPKHDMTHTISDSKLQAESYQARKRDHPDLYETG